MRPLLPLLFPLAVAGCSTPAPLSIPPLVDPPRPLLIPDAAGPASTSTTGYLAPKLTTTPVSPYPGELRQAGITGRAVVEFTVGTDGQAHDFQVVSATDDRIRQFLLTTIDTWRYQPALQNGRPVARRLRVPVRLELTD